MKQNHEHNYKCNMFVCFQILDFLSKQKELESAGEEVTGQKLKKEKL